MTVHRINSISYAELDRSYEIKARLGRGTFAQVYRAIHRETGDVYAVKEVNKSQLDEETKRLLDNELAVLKKVSKHPGIVTFHEKFECDQYIWFVLEYVDGGMLLDHLAKVGNFSENDARMFMKSTLRSMQFLAELGVVHRDIKPENILFDSKSVEWPTRLTDFGLSAKMDKNVLMYAACGTPAFCSPEVLQSQSYDCACDMWSFGIVLYIVLAGYPPFVTINSIVSGRVSFPDQEWSHISEEAKDVVRQMLIVDADRRITPKQALLHPWFSMKQSTCNLPNQKLRRFNVRRKCRIHYLAIQSANSLIGFVGRTETRDRAELLAEVERVRERIRRIEESEAIVQVSSPTTPEPVKAGRGTYMMKDSQIQALPTVPPLPPLRSRQSASQQPPLVQPLLTQSSLSETSQPHSKPALSSISQPKLRRRRKSLVLPPIDFAAEQLQAENTGQPFPRITTPEEEILRTEVAVMEKADVLLSHLDDPVPSEAPNEADQAQDQPPRKDYESENVHDSQNVARRDEVRRRKELIDVDPKRQLSNTKTETKETSHRLPIKRQSRSKKSLRPKLAVLDLENLRVS